MDNIQYLQHFITVAHRGYEDAIKDLTPAQFAHRPSDSTNHIAFTAWHWVRTEDNIVQFVLQRQSTVWIDAGLDVAWGLPRVAQGTGMAPVEAYNMPIPSTSDFLDYARKVWAKTGDFLARITQDELDRVTKVMPFGEIPVFQVLGQTLIAHGNQHLGEIWLTRELQGLKGIGF
jgi:DinB superfamily